MFAKVIILFAAVAAAHASLVGPYGWGVPVLGKAVVAPAIATVSTQKTAINHVAPAAPVLAAAPLAVAGPYGGLVDGHGWAGPLVGAPYGVGVGKLGLGYGYGVGLGKGIW